MTHPLLDEESMNREARIIADRILKDCRPKHSYRATVHDGGATHETGTEDPAVMAAWLRAVADSISQPKQ